MIAIKFPQDSLPLKMYALKVKYTDGRPQHISYSGDKEQLEQLMRHNSLNPEMEMALMEGSIEWSFE